VFSFLRTLTTWHYPHSPAARRAAVRRAAIDRYILLAGPTTAKFAAMAFGAVDNAETDRRTDA